MATEFFEASANITSKYKEALALVDEAIRNEEEGFKAVALEKYKKSIGIIDQGLSISVRLPDDIESVKTEWSEACKKVHNLKQARAEVVRRVGILIKTDNSDNEEEESEPFEKIDIEDARPRTYAELAQVLRNLQISEPSEADALQLIFCCDNVKFYNIKANGDVTTTSDNCTLRILRLDDDAQRGLKATCFMQIIKTSHAVSILDENQTAQGNDLSPSSTLGSPSTSASGSTSAFTLPSASIPAHESDPESACPSTNTDISIYPDGVDEFNATNNSSWIYPLVPGVSPCFYTEYGAFIFPDLEAAEHGTSVGILLPKEGSYRTILLEILEAILHGVIVQLKEGEERVPKDTATSVSENIRWGAKFISGALIKGAEKTGQFISYSTPYIMSKMERAPKPANPVSSSVKTAVVVAKDVTGTAASCAKTISHCVADKTSKLGKFLAPHIQKHGSTVLCKAFGMDESSANKNMSAALDVASSAIEGFGTVYSGLEQSANILGNNLSSNSVKILEHKYGSSTGALASETFDTVGNVINFSRNTAIIRPSTFVKSAAKVAGRAMVEEMSAKQNEEDPNCIPASALYPDISGLKAKIPE